MSEINTNKTEVKETTEPKEKTESQMDDSLSKDLDNAHKSKLDGNASTVEPTAEQQEGGDGSEQQKQPEDDDESGTGKKTETPPDAEQPTIENEQTKGGKFSTAFFKTVALFTLPFSGGPSTPDVQFPTVEVANSHHEAMDTQEESSSVLKFEGEDGTEYVCTYEIGKPYVDANEYVWDCEKLEKKEPTFIDKLYETTDAYKFSEQQKGSSQVEASMGDPADVQKIEPLTFNEAMESLRKNIGEASKEAIEQIKKQEELKESAPFPLFGETPNTEVIDTKDDSPSVLKFEGEDGTEYVCTYEIGKPYFEKSDKKDDEVE